MLTGLRLHILSYSSCCVLQAVLYNLVLCLWLSAFEPKVRSSIYAPEISLLISLIRTEPFEKVIRVAMAILRMVSYMSCFFKWIAAKRM